MKTTTLGGLGAAAIAGLLLAGDVSAGPERVTYPANFETGYTLYNQVDRLDRKRVRSFYVNREADAAAKSDAPLPDGTVLVMADRNAKLDAGGNPVFGADGRLVATGPVTNIFVMEKRAGWGESIPAELRNGDWDYAWFTPDGSLKPDAKYKGCFTCHMSRVERDYTFTYVKRLMDAGR
ncbi:MAG: cytochrome P460 family protein [Alphaproteobacteria bacterium]|nr:cytochrome P460 family protein [Alphaproteobacteria bacterium]